MIPSHIPLSPLGGYRMLQKHYTTFHTNEKYHHHRISNCLIRRGVQGLAFSGFRLDGQLEFEFPLHFPDREDRNSILPLQLSESTSHTTIMFELTHHHTHHLGSRKSDERWDGREICLGMTGNFDDCRTWIWRTTALCFIWRKESGLMHGDDREQWLRWTDFLL